MLIALDYDETYTRDPKFWNGVVALGEAHGHRFVCITGRTNPPERNIPPMQIICAGSDYKRHAGQRAGHMVDVWIDDMPEMIGPSLILTFEEPTK